MPSWDSFLSHPSSQARFLAIVSTIPIQFGRFKDEPQLYVFSPVINGSSRKDIYGFTRPCPTNAHKVHIKAGRKGTYMRPFASTKSQSYKRRIKGLNAAPFNLTTSSLNAAIARFSPFDNELVRGVLEILGVHTHIYINCGGIISNASRKAPNKGRKCSRTVGRAAPRSTWLVFQNTH